MRTVLLILLGVLTATQVYASETKWYTGDDRCPPPKDDGTYSAPYDAREHPWGKAALAKSKLFTESVDSHKSWYS